MNENIIKSAIEEMLIEDFLQFGRLPVHKFSRRHKHNMKKILGLYESNTIKPFVKPAKSSEGPRRFRWNRRTVIIALIIVFLAALAGCAAAIYSLGGFRLDVQSDNTELFLTDTENCPQTIEYVYVLKELPEGFMPLEHLESDTMVYTSYLNSDTKQTIVLCQTVKSQFSTHYNTEHFTLEEIMIGEHKGVCLGESRISIAWDNGDYVLDISANLDKKDVVEMAKNVKIVEK